MLPQAKPRFDAETDLVLGERDARSQIVWFLDYSTRELRSNRRLLTDAMAFVRANDTAIAIRPIVRPETPETLLVARALSAAAKQGEFEAMHQELLAHPEEITQQALLGLAENRGMDLERFRADWISQEIEGRTDTLQKQTQQLGLTGMGEIFIDGQLYEGVWDETALIEAIKRPLGHQLQVVGTQFSRWAASAGLVLILATIAALVFVNVGFHETYEHLVETVAGINFGAWSFSLTLEQWINDGLMAIFFLLVGLEIKREVVTGELSDFKRALFPVMGAVGGILVPALIYTSINWGHDTVNGWGVPMATDIAFTLGLIALLGKRVPTSLIVCVSALAIVDDLGAILVIALFYGHGFHLTPILLAGGVLASMVGLNRARVYQLTPYLILGGLMWYLVLQSGVHATLAGVLTAMTIPSRKSGNVFGVASQARNLFEEELRAADYERETGDHTVSEHTQHRLQEAVGRLREPGFHLQHAIENWSSFLILPLFAFFNMGIGVRGVDFDVTAPESLGVILGLVIGKPLGIVGLCWLSSRIGLTTLPAGVTWMQMIGAGCLGGVGFTMSIFIASSAFGAEQVSSVKLSILIASLMAAAIGMVVLYGATSRFSEEAG